MPFLLAIALGIVQGLTEFLPVSSSGHLVVSRALFEPWLGAIEAPLAFDIVVHAATGLVVAFFLRDEILDSLRALFARSELGVRVRQLAVAVVLATIPAVVVGFTCKDLIEQSFSSLSVALNGFLITAVLLEIAHRKQLKLGDPIKEGLISFDWQIPNYWQALIIGIAQAMAIMPGVSRSGSTIAVALILGLGPITAVRFSFFLLLPVVFGGLLLELDQIRSLGEQSSATLAAAFFTTALVGYLALKALVWVVRGAKLRYFAIYVLLLSVLMRVFY